MQNGTFLPLYLAFGPSRIRPVLTPVGCRFVTEEMFMSGVDKLWERKTMQNEKGMSVAFVC